MLYFFDVINKIFRRLAFQQSLQVTSSMMLVAGLVDDYNLNDKMQRRRSSAHARITEIP